MPREAITNRRSVQSSAQCQSRKAQPDEKAADKKHSAADESRSTRARHESALEGTADQEQYH